MRTEFNITIKESSKTDMTARERVLLKDTSNAVKLDEVVTEDGTPFVLSPVAYAVLAVHNEKAKSDDKDYEQYLILDSDGNKYVTGSQSFWNSFADIWSDMEGEPFEMGIYKKPSKNYTGKCFLTCSIV